ncbi:MULTISPECIES: hypothetical protein [unclassified Streptomyces]|uniref:PASTA domain-containing protein n=1 Tax=unclassified Streptomyces TaxID=2593676 RepID=UPI0033BDEEA2
MRARTALIPIAVFATALTGCDSVANQQDRSRRANDAAASKASPSYAADSIFGRCKAQQWPQPMPDVEGRTFEPLSKELMCFDNLEALAPDGHDVMTDAAGGLGAWIVVSSTPGPGAKVRPTTPITLELREG